MQKLKAFVGKRAIYIIIVVALSVGLSIGVSLALNKRNRSSPRTSVCASNVQCVGLYTDAAEPSAITVEVGGTVQFNSADGKVHNLTIGGEGTQGHGTHSQEVLDTYQSGDFRGDEAWQVTFSKPGTYDFRDRHNDKIKATVIVYQPGADTTIKR